MNIPEKQVIELHFQFPDTIDHERLSFAQIRKIGMVFHSHIQNIISKLSKQETLRESELIILNKYNEIRNAITADILPASRNAIK